MGGAEDASGEVEFIARYLENGLKREHHETALFRKEKGTWLFTEGAMVKPKPLVSEKVGRNEPCPCASGAKYKKCCGK
jgi:SEC-C motif-containing protein